MLSGPRGKDLAVSKRLQHWPSVTDTSVEVDGRRVRILRAESRASAAADAEPQLLIHGLGGSSVTWVQVMEGLSEHGLVVAVDLPGFGRTPTTDDDQLTVHG